MNRTNAAVAAVFLLLGAYLTVSSFALPGGLGRLPGAGFFPRVIGVVTLALALSLLLRAVRQSGTTAFEVGNRGAIGGVIALTILYLALWGTGYFALRTAVFLLLFLRLLGERWGTSGAVAAALTAAVTLAFQYGLRVSLE